MAAPEITRNFLDIVEGGRIGLTTDNLNATLEGVAPAEIFFQISPVIDPGTGEALPIGGEFLLRDVVSQSFSLQDVSSGAVEFRHLGSNFPPQYTVSALFGTERSAESSPTIIFEALNDGPIVRRNVLSLNEGETVTLTTDNLLTTDEESSAAQLRYTILRVSNGNFQRVDGGVVTNLTVGDTFTQAEIDSQVIRFRHDGSETEPRYALRVLDGGLPGKNPKGNNTSVTIERFTRVNDAPVIRANAISLTEGQTIAITTSNLAATDVEDNDSTLQFRITSVTNGRFELLDGSGAVIAVLASPSTPPIAFTQNDVIQGRVRFVNDPATNTPPTYTLEVSDSGNPDGVKTVSQPGAVQFFPVNDPPVLQTVALTLEEGETLPLSSSNLRVTDEESGPADIRYTVLSASGGKFVSQADGSTLTTFTQADLNAGTVVAFQHDSGNVSPVFSLRVTDGDGASIVLDSGSGVNFTAINDAPTVQRATLVVTEGGRVTFSSGNNLAATDEESTASQLTYTVTLDNSGREEAKRDRFIVNGTETFGPTVTFTQADVNAGRVEFVHGGSNLTPSLTATLRDTPLGAGGPVNVVPVNLQITFTPTNDTPLFSLNTLTITEGGTVVLSGVNNLTTTDEESGAVALTYTIDAVSNGTFQRRVAGGAAVNLQSGNTFTQAEVNDGLIQFVHDNSNIAPTYTLTVTDTPVGNDPAKSVTRSVEIPPGGFITSNDAPKLGNNTLTLTEGQSLFLTADNLSATDEEDPSGTLTFTVTDITNGRFERVTFDQGGAETGVENLTPAVGGPVGFTQAEVAAGRIRFVNDPATNTAPTYTVTVRDSGGLTESGTAAINFTATNDVPIFSLNTLTIAEGGTVVLNQGGSNLLTTDEETPAVDLVYTIDAVSSGTFQRQVGVSTFANLAVGSTFTQAEADGGLIRFVHDGSETAPSYTLTVKDTPVGNDPAKSVTRTVEIPSGGFTLSNDAPELGNNTLTLTEGDVVFLTSKNLSATDEEDADDSLTFTVTGITNGRFERVTFDQGGAETGVENLTPAVGGPVGFTQAEVAAGRIRFVHDPANDTAPTYTVTVTDAGGLTDSGTAAINFTAKNDLPVLADFQMTIAEGEAVRLDGTSNPGNVLLVTDEETAANSLIYTVTQTAGGRFVNATGAAVTTFSQADVTAGAILFQQDNSNTSPSFKLSLTDGANVLVVTSADDLGVTFTPFNDVPTVLKSALAIAEGGTVTLSPDLNLNVTDEESTPEQLVYTATVTSQDSARPDGFKVKGNFQTGAGITFTQADVNAGLVQFIHGGSNNAPVVALELSDRTLPDAVVGGNNPNRLTLDFPITFTVENDMPLVEKNVLTLSEGETVTLSQNLLLTTDEESAPANLVYTIDSVTNGQFQVFDSTLGVVTRVLTKGDTFTQAQVNQGLIQFAHDGGEVAPSYTLTVVDEPQVAGAAPNQVTTTVTIPEGGFKNVNDNPTFSKNQLSLKEGDRVTLTRNNLAATDVESPTGRLTFEISDVQGGQFFLRGKALAPEQTFNTASISFGELEFQHDGKEAAPSYTVTVRDPDGGVSSQAAAITFQGVNDPPEITQNFFEIREGVRLELSTANLLATDAETLLDSKIRFTVSNVVGGAFFDLEANPITSFTQEQLRNGDINFVPSPAAEPDVIPAFDITVDDGEGGVITVPANVSFISVNDAPALVNNSLTLKEGETVVLTSSNLSAIDSDNVASSLVFTITNVTGGRFERVSAGGTVVENLTPEGAPPVGFTQAEVAAGSIRFVHDPAVDTPPTYTVQVRDPDGLSSSGAAAITFAPENDLPVLKQLAIAIAEGQTIPLSTANLQVTDEESAPANLTYTVTTVTAGKFILLADDSELLTFTQADLDAGNVVGFRHDNSETAPSFTLSVTDGVNTVKISSADLDGITYRPVNDTPVVNPKAFAVTEGGSVVLTPAALNTTDVESGPADLTYQVTLTNGDAEQPDGFEVKGVLLTKDITFTQSDINAGLVKFIHGGSNFAPQIEMTVTDTFDPEAEQVTVPVALDITFTASNDVPEVVTNTLSLSEGETVTLSAANLLTKDEESAATGLTYTLDKVSSGQFQIFDPDQGVVTKVLTVGDTFTQAQVNQGLIQFAHDGSEVAPSYTLTVADEPLTAGEAPNTVTTTVTIPAGGFKNVNDAPTFSKNRLEIAEGGTVVFTTSNLLATDVDSLDSRLEFEITDVAQGTFFLRGKALAPGQTFNIAAIAFGELSFKHDGGEQPPSYTVIVRDDQGASNTAPADIVFTPVNDAPRIVKNTFTITEGSRAELSTDNLLAEDDETLADADLVFTVSDVVGGAFFDFLGTPINSFTQEQLRNREINFLPVPVAGPDIPPTFTITVKDGDGGSVSAPANVTFISVNEAPVLSKNSFTITEGALNVLTPKDLAATDDDTPAADLTFTVSDVEGGRFLIGTTIVTQFTQAQLVAGAVVFEDNGDQEPPRFNISVSDGELASEAEAAVIASFVNTNDAPVAVDDGGDDFVTDEKTPFLTGDVLLNDEDEDPLDELRVVAVNGQAVTPGTSVTLASGAIVTFGAEGEGAAGTFSYNPNGQFNFLNVGAVAFDTFEYTIADLDGETSTAAVRVEVRGVDDAPTLVSNSLTLFSGQSVVLSSANVLAIDPDTPPANLVFTASNVTGGQFLLGGQVVESFTQQDVLNGSVIFQHDGSQVPPSYELSVTDGTSVTQPVGVTINRFIPVNLAAIDGGIFDYAQTLRFLGRPGVAADELGGISLPDLFDEQYYLATNPDVLAAVQAGALPSGYQHFIASGITEGRNPSILYNEAFYLATNPTVGDAVRAGAIASGLLHFLSNGAAELRVASPHFNQQTYLDENPDVLAALRDRRLNSGFEHYVEAGANEGRSPELFLFNEGFYLANYSDVKAAVQAGAFVDGFAHFIQFGQFEGRAPSSLFDEASYLALNPDVAAAVSAGVFTSGFSHYVQAGRFEDRLVFA